MGPIVEGVGYSENTPIKLKHFRTILGMHTAITNAVIQKNTYFNRNYLFVDATAGPGRYPHSEERLKGSPLIFLEIIHGLKLDYVSHFIDENPENIRRLRRFTRDCHPGSVILHGGEYELELENVDGENKQHQLGLLYVDPNGVPDFDALAEFLQRFPKMEVLLHLSATSLKRVPHAPSLEEVLQVLGKENWVLRRPSKDGNQWFFLLGSSTDLFGKYKKIGFFPLESQEAQEFFPKLNLTKSALVKKQQADFFDMTDEDVEQ